MKRAALLLLAVPLLAACGSSSTKAGPSSQLHKLQGMRLPHTPGWVPIASPFKKPRNVDGTVTPPIQTTSELNSVAFLEFRSTAAATAFFRKPTTAGLFIGGPLRPLSGATGVPKPSRGLDVRTCLFKGGPAKGRTSGSPNAAGKCTTGTPSSLGVAIIVRRGKFVVISEATDHGNTVVGGIAPASSLTNSSLGASRYANEALALMQKVGIKFG